MSEFQVRIHVQVRDVNARPRFREDKWRDDHVRINVTADHPDDAVRIVQKAISQLVDRDSQRRISLVDESEKPCHYGAFGQNVCGAPPTESHHTIDERQVTCPVCISILKLRKVSLP